MKRGYNLLFTLLVPVAIFMFTGEILYPVGSPGGRTGSPGDGGANCTECHQGNPPVVEEFWILVPALLTTGYTPGTTYDVNIIGMNPGASKFGFEATAEDNNGNKTGTFAPYPDGRTKAINNGKAITHTLAGTVPLADSVTEWLVKWTAPATNTGNITFYVAVNTANGNGLNTGDVIHLSQFTATSPSGIDDLAGKESFEIFPNPTKGPVTLKHSSPENELIKILNASGRTVYSSVMESDEQILDLSRFESGMYFVRVGEQTARVLKY